MNSPNGSHLTNEELLEEMDGHPSARMAEHCAICPACRALRSQATAVLGALRFQPEPALSGGLRDRLLQRHARAYRPRPAILRLATHRIPLYQIAAVAAAAILIWQVGASPKAGTTGGTVPPFVAAASDLWSGSQGSSASVPGLFGGRDSPEISVMPSRPPLELTPNLNADRGHGTRDEPSSAREGVPGIP